ncbi:hypothetical protein [Streptomyces scabiei]|uniref:hypothetical protein n=1 Tax=Streptomyces scabiei TaxID=1930 RepID=UPI000765E42B|nr:hypothetical protein [Streptomyces scabiei]
MAEALGALPSQLRAAETSVQTLYKASLSKITCSAVLMAALHEQADTVTRASVPTDRRGRPSPPGDTGSQQDTGHLPTGGGMRGARRRAEIRAIADHLALAPLTAPRTHRILLAAAPVLASGTGPENAGHSVEATTTRGTEVRVSPGTEDALTRPFHAAREQAEWAGLAEVEARATEATATKARHNSGAGRAQRA